MKKRTLIPVFYGLLTAFLGLAPLSASLTYSRTATLEAAEQRTARVAQEVAFRVGEILLSAEAVLADLAYDAREGCRPRLIDELREATVLALHIRTVAYADAEGRVRCTSFGLTEGEAALPAVEPIAPPGAVLRFTPPLAVSYAPGRYIVALHRLKHGASLQVLIDPEDFLVGLDEAVIGEAGRVEVRMLETTLAALGPPLEAAGDFITARGAVGLYGAEVTVAVSRAWALRGWADDARVYVILGLVASGILVTGAILLLRRRFSFTGRLQQAIRNEELEVHYQAIVDIERRRCVGAEALIRWRDPERGLLRPELFIALAEDSGLILPITDWLMRRVVVETGPLLAADPKLHVAINLAALHFRSPRLAPEIARIFREGGVDLGQVVFEVTERGLIDDPVSRQVLGELRRQGAAIALDDFGTGYSNLAYLQDLKVDYLKIDQRFAAAADAPEPATELAAHLASAIIAMARKLGLTIIAEGIETAEQIDFLRGEGVRLVQGWYYTEPLPAEDFAKYLAAMNAEGEGAGEKAAAPGLGRPAPA